MISVRQAAANAGIDGNFSVVFDFLGHIQGAPDGTTLRSHTEAMEDRFVNINLILIGPEDMTGTDFQMVDQAMLDIRVVYSQAPLGVHIEVLAMEGEDADDFKVLTKESRVKKLLRRFRGPGDRNLDVFVAPIVKFDGTQAAAAGEDKCKKKSRPGLRGAVIGLNFAQLGLNPPATTLSPLGMNFAHETGHLLGLDHPDDSGNFMFPGGLLIGMSDSQANTMRSRCSVNDG